MEDAESPIALGPVPAWSFSRLVNYEKCPHMTYLASVKKVKRLAPKADCPAERGTAMHEVAENYVKRESTETIKEMGYFQEEFDLMQAAFDNGDVELEGDWGFDIDWQKTGWYDSDVWARIKLDAFWHIDDSTARVIDYKSGKKFGNEFKHTSQCQLYMVGAFMRHPELDLIQTELWYLDQKSYMKKTYTRDKLPLYLKKFTKRALAMTTATEFPAKPNKSNCRWCDYGIENGTGDCIYAVPYDYV